MGSHRNLLDALGFGLSMMIGGAIGFMLSPVLLTPVTPAAVALHFLWPCIGVMAGGLVWKLGQPRRQ
jgi:hypothetical protein